MTLRVLFAGRPEDREVWSAALRAAAERAGERFALETDPARVDPAAVDVMIVDPKGPVRDFGPYVNLRAALSMWAGVEALLANPTLKAPLARMVERGMTEGMTEYVVGHVMRIHLGMDAHLFAPPGRWDPTPPPLARQRHVAVLGLGELGAAAAEALARLRFVVHGWSRRLRDVPGVICRAGSEGLEETLRAAQIAVLLLPATPATAGIMDARRLALLPRGAAIVNPGRGALIDDDALLAALDSGHVAHATLDVFRHEPLPPEHPYWTHPRVLVTPHIASATRPDTAAEALVAQIGRIARGAPPLHVVDRAQGY
ncbi:NAD(P)-dependent oxidoreductase [Oceanicella actignis]|uniref:Glyoxylate/hydroxypyruvate reductase A n=1 Tax=Oceanicella actignis TaxID=1189325 RepID=A0A1M7S8M1_9RHOB|nr:NAD(P)-dependent oxidoreductase [Oceanicella actignis]SET32277.1 glyoxylate/hydroxypyruvate reductase A [Oceanicella actignis]SHN54790.1 glyoxylate/hydroxypyruvate reductase A [Oceanicella actignis]